MAGLSQSAAVAAMSAKALSWCNDAMTAMTIQPPDAVTEQALSTHFRFDQITDASKKSLHGSTIVNNFYRITQALLSNNVFIDISKSEAAAFFPTLSGKAGWEPPPAFVTSRGGKKMIYLTPNYREWENPGGYGPNALAAMLVHEAGHYISDSIIDYAYEWTSPTTAGINAGAICVPGSSPSCLVYSGLTPEQALNNASCYPSFAAHITRKADLPRFGAGNPSL